MLAKSLSFLSLLACFPLVFLAAYHPQDPLLLFVSGNYWLMAGRIVMLGGLVYLCFSRRGHSVFFKYLISALGIGLLFFGFAGVAVNSVEYNLYDYFKPLDYLLIAETGIILWVLSAEIKVAAPAPAKKPQPKSAWKLWREQPRTSGRPAFSPGA